MRLVSHACACLHITIYISLLPGPLPSSTSDLPLPPGRYSLDLQPSLCTVHQCGHGGGVLHRVHCRPALLRPPHIQGGFPLAPPYLLPPLPCLLELDPAPVVRPHPLGRSGHRRGPPGGGHGPADPEATPPGTLPRRILRLRTPFVFLRGGHAHRRPLVVERGAQDLGELRL